MVRYYALRWLIERLHYTLKSGCGIEKLQLETVQRLQNAVATYLLIAWRLLWLTYRVPGLVPRVHAKSFWSPMSGKPFTRLFARAKICQQKHRPWSKQSCG
jgi:Transposase DDE domain